MGKELKYLIIHSTNTREGKDMKRINGIQSLYSDVVDINGNIVNFLSQERNNRLNVWGLKCDNKEIDSVSRHIAYIGGANKDNTNAKDTRLRI